MKQSMIILFSVFVLCFAASAGTVEYPAIKGYGPVTPLPNAAVQPDKSLTYKVLFDVTAEPESMTEPNPGLEHAASFINTMASAGMDYKAMDLVLLVQGPATPSVLKNEEYELKYGLANPNLKLIEDLGNAGIRLLV